MRRKVMIITAICVMVGAAAAYAATNNYAGSGLLFTKGTGTPTKPVPVGFRQTYAVANNDPTKAAQVLVDTRLKIYGLVSNAKYFPTCSATQMVAQKSDTFCPKKSKFASGVVNSLLGGTSLVKSGTFQCNPDLDVFNAGKGKLWFFFTTHNALQCGPLHTGDTAPYPGFVKQQGKWQVTDVPLPADVSTKVANHADFYGSLVHEVLTWYRLTTKVKGKTVGNNASIGCVKGSRPYSITFTSTPDGVSKEVVTVNGTSKC